MPRIIPIRDLKNTAAISQMCSESTEPIYVTKNGYGEMVLMSMKAYEEKFAMLELYEKLEKAEEEIKAGKTKNAKEALKRLREEYHV
ncbi:MAG: type II toxin-antitoxin system Phd/YefM family antitoxin [Candidatus Avoscillospira sp.]